MEIKWTSKALSDLARLYEFLAAVSPSAAASTIQMLTLAPDNLQQHPRLGQKLADFSPREVRRIVVGEYEMRYEIQGAMIYILRLWHTREYR